MPTDPSPAGTPHWLPEPVRRLHRVAAESPSGRAAETVYGGSGHALRQTVIALRAGMSLAEHENPGEATVLVLDGHVQLTAPSLELQLEGHVGDLLVVPPARHVLDALVDSAVLLTVVKKP